MRFQMISVIVGCIALPLIASACSMADDQDHWTAHERRSHSEAASGGTLASGKADDFEPTACVEHDDCPGFAHTAHWCSPEGTCRYACEQGYGDANGEASADGCECALSNEGREVCNGADDDCDGVVDNPFVGGQVAAGGHQTCAVDATGAVSCWGEHSLERRARTGIDAFWEVVAGPDHGCALTRDGEAFCWGDNSFGQVGPAAGRHAERPVRLSDELRFVDIAAGAEHSCGLTYSGAVYCWGNNDYGQLGDGSVDERLEPVLVDSNIQDFLDVTAGDFHTCAARATGEVMCWGANILGQVGQVDPGDVLSPTEVEVREALIFVEAGANHTCGITGEGRVHCWGNNSYGQLGNDTRISTHQPKPVDGDLEFLALSAGTTHTCGIADDARLWCWGSSTAGQLGAKASGDAAFEPHLMSSALAFSDLSAGADHTCALSRDGRLHCWGDGSHGQLEGGCR